jgi:hypothetical protein
MPHQEMAPVATLGRAIPFGQSVEDRSQTAFSPADESEPRPPRTFAGAAPDGVLPPS